MQDNITFTCRTSLLPHEKDDEDVVAARLDKNCNFHAIPEGSEVLHFMTGPIADKLYAYESLGYSPKALKGIVEKHRRDLAWRLAVNSTYGIIARPTLEATESFIKEEREKAMLEDRKRAMEAYIRADITATKSLLESCKNIIKNTKAKIDRDSYMKIKKVIFNDPATIVFWADGSMTVVRAENEPFDPEKGLAMAISKRALGNDHGYYDVFKKHLKKYKKGNADEESNNT